MENMDNAVEYKISMRHHWWIDAGLAGLYNIAARLRDINPRYDCIALWDDQQNIIFRGPSNDILTEFLYHCYEDLANRHWNVSTKRQKEDKDLVVYHRETDTFELMPRRKPAPIPNLFTKGSSFRAEGIEYANLPPDMQERVDSFLKKHNKTLWGSKKFLLYELPVCHPQIELFPTKKKKNICSICGQESVCSNVSQPSFLLFASSTAALSFNSEGKRPDKICWECEFLSKFAVEAAHYKSDGDDLFILQIATGHVGKLIDTQNVLGCQSPVRQLDTDYYQSNIGTRKSADRLLYYARKPHELLWAFYHDTYHILRTEHEQHADASDALAMQYLQPFMEAPLRLIMLVITQKGQTFILKEVIAYTETAYVFRLIDALREEALPDNKFLFKVFQDLYLPVRKDKPFDASNYLWRNRIFRKVLEKKPILQDVECMVFKKSLEQDYPYLGNLLQFTRKYQMIIGEGKGMNKEQVEVAVNLGKQIVISAKEMAKDGSESNFDRVKGDLFALRKTRTVTDFLEQLNRIQFRYAITVSNQITGGILMEPGVSFEDFKSYCLIAALNTYNNFKRPKQTKSTDN